MKTVKYIAKKKVVMVSNCCGERDRMVARDDAPNYSDVLICPRCKEHCVFEPESEGDK